MLMLADARDLTGTSAGTLDGSTMRFKSARARERSQVAIHTKRAATPGRVSATRLDHHGEVIVPTTLIPQRRDILRPTETLEAFAREAIARDRLGITAQVSEALWSMDDASPAERARVSDAADLGNLVYHHLNTAYLETFGTVLGLGCQAKINRAVMALYQARLIAQTEQGRVSA